MILIVLGLLCLYGKVRAQDDVAGVVPLKIGDRVPEVLMGRQFDFYSDGKVSAVHLSSYRDKLVILDFWATSCKACVPELFRLDSLGAVFLGRFVPVPVTYQSAADLRSFEKVQGTGVRSIVGDKLLKAYFPHRMVPHQVWVRNGIVVAIASNLYATSENIALALGGGPLSFREKMEQTGYDSAKPLFAGGNGGDGSQLIAQSLFSRYVPGLNNAGERFLYRKGYVSQTNGTFTSLYSLCLKNSIPEFPVESRFIIEGSQELRSKILYAGTKEKYMDWLEVNGLCYNLVLPAPVSADELRATMRADLDRFFLAYFGVEVAVEKRLVKCRVLKRSGDISKLSRVATDLPNPVTGYALAGQPLSMLLAAYSVSNYKLGMPVVDRTGISGNVNLSIQGSLRDFSEVNRQLAGYGLVFSDELAETQMIIVRQVGKGSALQPTGKEGPNDGL